MRLGFERNQSSDETEDAVELRFYEQHLARFLGDAFSDSAAQVRRGIHFRDDWKAAYFTRKYEAKDGTVLTVRQTNWSLHRPLNGGTLARDVWIGEAYPDRDGVMRPRYHVTVAKKSYAYAVDSRGTVDAADHNTAVDAFEVVVDGDRTDVYEKIPVSLGPNRPSLLQRSPFPVDPATAERLTTLLYTSTPLDA